MGISRPLPAMPTTLGRVSTSSTRASARRAPGGAVTRRRALGAIGVGACTACGLAACAPEDEGYGGAGDPVAATEDAISLAELPENTTTLVNFGGQQPYVAIVRGTGQDVRGMSGYCTHQGCAVAMKDGELDCPCHGSAFDASTGEPLHGPASTPLPEVPLRIEGDTVHRVR